MNRQEIIDISQEGTSGILLDLIIPYKKSLHTYFKQYYCCEPILVVTSVFNSCSYGFIAPSNEFYEAVEIYLDADTSLNEEDRETEREVIGANSIILKNL